MECHDIAEQIIAWVDDEWSLREFSEISVDDGLAIKRHARAIAQMLVPQEPPALQDDMERCAVCGWPLSESVDKGCVRGNCSQRPLPDRFYAPERADAEYGSAVSKYQTAAPLVVPARVPEPLVDLYLRRELCAYLDTLAITGENIGDLRRSLFMPWESAWNGIVREETASREGARGEGVRPHDPNTKDEQSGSAGTSTRAVSLGTGSGQSTATDGRRVGDPTTAERDFSVEEAPKATVGDRRPLAPPMMVLKDSVGNRWVLAEELENAIAHGEAQIATLTQERDGLKAEWSVMARACGNWRDFGMALTEEARMRRRLIDDADYQAAARAILERDNLQATTGRFPALDALLDSLERALKAAFSGSAEHGAFFRARASAGEYVPSPFMVLNELRAVLRADPALPDRKKPS